MSGAKSARRRIALLLPKAHSVPDLYGFTEVIVNEIKNATVSPDFELLTARGAHPLKTARRDIAENQFDHVNLLVIVETIKHCVGSMPVLTW